MSMRLEVEKFDEFEIVIDGSAQKVSVKKETSIDEQSLSDEFVRHPSVFSWYSTVLALYEAKSDRLKYQLDVMCAQLDHRIRQDAAKSGDKIVEKQVESAMKMDPKYQVLQEEHLDTKLVVKRLSALVRGLEVKRDMLIQLGARLRAELQMGKMGA